MKRLLTLFIMSLVMFGITTINGAQTGYCETPLPARGTYNINGDANDLSVFAVSVDAQELFTAIAGKINLPIVIDDTVSRKITINIEHRPSHAVIESIISAYGLSMADVNGVTMISEGIPRSPSSYLLSDIGSIRTKYVDANIARNLLPVFLQDYVKVNAEQNSVILSAPTDVLAKFRDDIEQFDTPASQILVDLVLVELKHNTGDTYDLTSLWQNANRGISVDPGGGNIVVKAVTDLPNNFTATLNALQQKGVARVKANPRIATISGRHASFFVGQQRYLVTPIDSEYGQRNYIDAGVRLDITPYTGGQGLIWIDFDTEVSTLTALDPITKLPDKNTRTASTAVRVRDGQTIIIGGLVQQETRATNAKTPILGDIPLLGPLFFRTHDIKTTNSELVLFITPHLLSSTGHLPDDQEKELKDRFLKGDTTTTLPSPEMIKEYGNTK